MHVWLAARPFPLLGRFSRRSSDRSPGLDASLAWAKLPFPAQLYVAAAIIAGGSILVAVLPRTLPSPGLFAVLIVSACLTSLWKVNLPISKASGSTLSVSYA